MQNELLASELAADLDKQARVGLGLMPKREEESAILLDTQASVLQEISNEPISLEVDILNMCSLQS